MSKQETPLDYMLSMTQEEFEHWVWCGEHGDDNVVDLHKEVLRLRKELEEAKRAKDVMSNYLNELMHNTANTVIASQIYNVLREAIGREEFDPVGQEGEGNQCK